MYTQVPYGDNYQKKQQYVFRGLNHTIGAMDDELSDCLNITAEYFPVLASRKKRSLYRTLTKANGLGGRDVLMWADGTEFYYDGIKRGDVEDSKKTFYYIGVYIIIWPDKKFYNTKSEEFGSLELIYNASGGQIRFLDGTFAGQEAKANSINTSGVPFDFEVGDAVTISGSTYAQNNITPIIREISEDKRTLRFYENIFYIPSGSSFLEPNPVTITRAVPDMDYLCENENRLWGCKGDEIFASKLGNPKVWNDFDGLSTGSWAGMVGSAGDFTGCYSYLGYATFFKEGAIHKVYGSKPSDFQYSDGPSMGLQEGNAKSFAVAGETLFYRTRAGLVRYNGGFPYSADKELGDYSPRNAVAGSDGINYYVSGIDKNGNGVFLCYDTQTSMWLKQDEIIARDFAYAHSGLYFLAGNEIWKVDGTGEPGESLETDFISTAIFGDYYEGSANRKDFKGLQFRAEVEDGKDLKVFMEFNGSGYWEELQKEYESIYIEKKAMYFRSTVPRRYDYARIKFECNGHFKLFTIAREYQIGSDVN